MKIEKKRIGQLFRRKICWFVLPLVVSCLLPITTIGATLSFLQSNEAKKDFQLLLMVDKIDKLAGMKVSMTYDKEMLKFVKAEKTQKTSSLMHVVNDKVPGKIIVVMAGAKGISGKNISLLKLSFTRKSDDKNKKSSMVKVTEIQLMSEELKDIKGSKPEIRLMSSFAHK